MKPVVLVLGGGTGGIITAREIIKNSGKNCKVYVFEKEEKNVFAPSLLWLMVGNRKREKIYRNTKDIAVPGLEVVIGAIEKVDPEKITVTVKGQTYKGDYMVISLGVEQATEYQLNQYGYDFFTLDGAAAFYEQLRKFKGGKIAVLIPSLPFKCPAAPYEAAMLIESFLRKMSLKDKTQIALYTPEPGPMPVAGVELSAAVKQMLQKKGIQYFPEHQLASATENTLTFSNGFVASYDLLAYTPKHQCPSVIKHTTLVGTSGWIEVNRDTLETPFPNVYAIGDNTYIPLEMGKPLPKAGVFAHYQAEVVAHNISRKINGLQADKIFTGEGQCFLEMGESRAGYAGGNFYGSPLPQVNMRSPGYRWHFAKVLFEKYWFFKYF
jgi:sulfide:quinone oxidoreductase